MTSQPQAESLPLWPDEVDVELPDVEVTYAPHEGTPFEGLYPACALDAEGRCHRWNHDHEPAVPSTPPLADTLVDALADVLDALERGRAVPGARLRHYRTLVGRPAVVDDAATPEDRRDEGIARAAARWTEEEVAQVDTAIRAIVDELRERQRTIIAQQRAAGYRLTDDAFPQTFTTARVWAKLAGAVPVTKGIAGRMTAARSAGLIKSTGRTATPPKDAPGPNNGQRLTVWEVLPA